MIASMHEVDLMEGTTIHFTDLIRRWKLHLISGIVTRMLSME